MSPQRERMSPVDTAWLRMDRENHLMAIKGLLVLKGKLSVSALRRLLQVRLVRRFPRFAHRVVQDDNAAWWEADPAFNLRNHIRCRRLDLGDPEAALRRLVTDLAQEPLDHRHPLWAVDLVPDLGLDTALIVRVHHCIADGMALMGVLMSLTSATAAGSLDLSEGTQPADPLTPHDELSLRCPWDSLLDPLTREGTHCLGMASSLLERYLQLVEDPDHAVLMRRMTYQALAALLHLLLLSDEGSACFKGACSERKRVAWARALDLKEIQAVARSLRCSVHEVVMACLTGALRRYLLRRGECVDGVRIRVLVPVNLRRRLHTLQLGNRFGLVPLMLPVYLNHPVERVRAVTQSMRALRQSLLPPLSLGLLGGIGMAPRAVQVQVAQLLAHKASGVVTQIPGPRDPVYLAGHRIERIMFWVPQSGDLGLGVSLSSYNGQLQLGLIADEQIMQDPEVVADLFKEEFNQLLLGLLLGLD